WWIVAVYAVSNDLFDSQWPQFFFSFALNHPPVPFVGGRCVIVRVSFVLCGRRDSFEGADIVAVVSAAASRGLNCLPVPKIIDQVPDEILESMRLQRFELERGKRSGRVDLSRHVCADGLSESCQRRIYRLRSLVVTVPEEVGIDFQRNVG